MSEVVSSAVRVLKDVRHTRSVRRRAENFARGASGVAGAEAFAHLQTFSLAAASVAKGRSTPRAVTLVLPELRPRQIFAGVRTALEFGYKAAAELDLPLRLVVVWAAPEAADLPEIRSYLRREFGDGPADAAEVISIDALVNLSVNDDDVWIGTHWSTAHPLDIACRLGVLRKEQIIYLVQDYEPGFYAWSSEFALARATYNAGFRFVVNSTPLRNYLSEAEGLFVPDERVFAPSLDLARLEEAAHQRKRSPNSQIMFYGRPSKPRNLFDIGMSAIQIAAAEFDRRGISASFISAGESHRSTALAGGQILDVRGKVPWNDYFALLASSDVLLSLQHSPHPSHPPLDAVAAGAFAVTNELGGTRAAIHPRLFVAEPDPSALASRLIEAADASRDSEPAVFDAEFVRRLGEPLNDVVTSTVSAMFS
ncbi:glycosyltransferase family 4 protein [Subtercola vilae]|uniref:Glycosyltransferase family 1 protein n=1 Tax=Subtercola vilae TaxID=2056433 RepID=A0A4T2BV83_9MICO|nr:glycosyltransferase family 4 protein [Subtercola vilae]TIH35585.1 hypothetical protein D4765_11010 [Subtercola vilae]